MLESFLTLRTYSTSRSDVIDRRLMTRRKPSLLLRRKLETIYSLSG